MLDCWACQQRARPQNGKASHCKCRAKWWALFRRTVRVNSLYGGELFMENHWIINTRESSHLQYPQCGWHLVHCGCMYLLNEWMNDVCPSLYVYDRRDLLLTKHTPSREVAVVQLLSCARLFAALWTAAPQAPLSSLSLAVCSNSCPLRRWCHPAVSFSASSPFAFSFPRNRVFSNYLALCIREGAWSQKQLHNSLRINYQFISLRAPFPQFKWGTKFKPT